MPTPSCPVSKAHNFRKKCHFTVRHHPCGHRTWTRPRVEHIQGCLRICSGKKPCTNMAIKPLDIFVDEACCRCRPSSIKNEADPFDILIERAEEHWNSSEIVARRARLALEAQRAQLEKDGAVVNKKASTSSKKIYPVGERNKAAQETEETSKEVFEAAANTYMQQLQSLDATKRLSLSLSLIQSTPSEAEPALSKNSVAEHKSVIGNLWNKVRRGSNKDIKEDIIAELDSTPQSATPSVEPVSHSSDDFLDEEEGWQLLKSKKREESQPFKYTGDWVHLN